MKPTTLEEKRAFCIEIMPVFLEYLRTNQSAIEQVELATVKDGIVSFPATQSLGGVLKTVRVPLSVITADIDSAESLARELAQYAKEQGDYAKAQAATALANGEYAETQGSYAKEQGDNTLAVRTTIVNWYEPYRSDMEQWGAAAKSAESSREAEELIRKANETARQDNEASRVAAELLRVAAENSRASAELERIESELARAEAELNRKAAEAQRQANEEIRLDGTFRQNADNGNWERLNQRSGEWEDTEEMPGASPSLLLGLQKLSAKKGTRGVGPRKGGDLGTVVPPSFHGA